MRIPLGLVINELDCNIQVSEFELQPRYYIHFRTNNRRNGINYFIPPHPRYGLNRTSIVWFLWVPLFNGISTFVRLFNARAILLEDQ